MPGYPMNNGLMLAVPHTGRGLPYQWAYAMHSLHPPMCYNVIQSTSYQMQVGEARQWFAEQAIAQKCKYLFFIDEDVTPPGHALRQLIYQADHHPEGAVFGGIYCHKSQPPMPMIFRGLGTGPYWDWHLGEFFEVDGIAMGCTLIRVEVFEKLEKPWFKTVDDLSGFYDGINKAEMWTEDLYFCAKVRDKGFKVFADGGVICSHWDLTTMKPTTLPADCLPMRRTTTSKKGEKKIIDLGCGEAKYQTDEGDVLTVDIREEVSPDYRCDLGQLPFAGGEFDIVFSSHTLEHFPRAEVDKVLDEWIRILKPEGELRLVLPNVEWAADQIKAGVVNDDVMNVLYGAQTYGENFHKFCFTPKVLTDMLTARGFKKIDVELTGYNILARAWKQPPIEASQNGHKSNGHKKLRKKK
jgi:predicted SAM-dependent methyltransferase